MVNLSFNKEVPFYDKRKGVWCARYALGISNLGREGMWDCDAVLTGALAHLRGFTPQVSRVRLKWRGLYTLISNSHLNGLIPERHGLGWNEPVSAAEGNSQQSTTRGCLLSGKVTSLSLKGVWVANILVYTITVANIYHVPAYCKKPFMHIISLILTF